MNHRGLSYQTVFPDWWKSWLFSPPPCPLFIPFPLVFSGKIRIYLVRARSAYTYTYSRRPSPPAATYTHSRRMWVYTRQPEGSWLKLPEGMTAAYWRINSVALENTRWQNCLAIRKIKWHERIFSRRLTLFRWRRSDKYNTAGCRNNLSISVLPTFCFD